MGPGPSLGPGALTESRSPRRSPRGHSAGSGRLRRAPQGGSSRGPGTFRAAKPRSHEPSAGAARGKPARPAAPRRGGRPPSPGTGTHRLLDDAGDDGVGQVQVLRSLRHPGPPARQTGRHRARAATGAGGGGEGGGACGQPGPPVPRPGRPRRRARAQPLPPPLRPVPACSAALPARHRGRRCLVTGRAAGREGP